MGEAPRLIWDGSPGHTLTRQEEYAHLPHRTAAFQLRHHVNIRSNRQQDAETVPAQEEHCSPAPSDGGPLGGRGESSREARQLGERLAAAEVPVVRAAPGQVLDLGEGARPDVLGIATTLSGTISTGTNASYHWDFGDETFGSRDVVPHTYPAVGVYTAVVTVSNSVNSLTGTTIVTIREPVGYGYLPLVLKG